MDDCERRTEFSFKVQLQKKRPGKNAWGRRKLSELRERREMLWARLRSP